jgi:cytochrome c oxidase subunit 3
MSVVTEEIKGDIKGIEGQEVLLDIGSPPPPARSNGDGGDGDTGEPSSSFPVSKGQLGLWLVLTAIAMLFAGLSSAYIVMRGAPAWQNVALPAALWVNTFVLLASSVTIEWARRQVQADRMGPTKFWMGLTAGLGLVFLIGQVVAWRQLVAVGVYLPTTLHSSFLYILTGAHALHILGGLAALGYVLIQTLRNQYTASNHEPVKLCATYWHFMDGLWVYLFLLLILA